MLKLPDIGKSSNVTTNNSFPSYSFASSYDSNKTTLAKLRCGDADDSNMGQNMGKSHRKHTVDTAVLRNSDRKHTVDTAVLRNSDRKHTVDTAVLRNSDRKHTVDTVVLRNSETEKHIEEYTNRAANRRFYIKGLSPWFPGGDCLDIMETIAELEEPVEENTPITASKPCKNSKTVMLKSRAEIRKSASLMLSPHLEDSLNKYKSWSCRKVNELNRRCNSVPRRLDRPKMREQPTFIEKATCRSRSAGEEVTSPVYADRHKKLPYLVEKYLDDCSSASITPVTDDEEGVSMVTDSINITLDDDTRVHGEEDNDDVFEARYRCSSREQESLLVPALGANQSREAAMAQLMGYEDKLRASRESQSNLNLTKRVLSPSNRLSGVWASGFRSKTSERSSIMGGNISTKIKTAKMLLDKTKHKSPDMKYTNMKYSGKHYLVKHPSTKSLQNMSQDLLDTLNYDF